MSIKNLQKVNTKLKAYKLVHDPVILLNLIYSKYGDIDEDLDLLYINQLVYDKSSRYNILFKEFQYLYNGEEFLKRFYQKYESNPRIPKLSEYYKNYHLFFCRPNFTDIVISDLMENYGDDKAEVFYKNNYENSKSKSKNEQSDKQNSESLSSLDNITDNKIIFTKKTKKIIDKNLDNNYGTLTLTTNSIKSNINNNHSKIKKDKNNKNDKNDNNTFYNYNDGLISARSINDSFEKYVHNLIYYKKSKKNDKKMKKEISNTNKNNNGGNTNNNDNNKQNNGQSGKKLNNKIGINYGNKKINKNIIYSLNINNTPMTTNNGNINIQNKKNKNSLFSLLKSKNFINYTKTENNISNNINGKPNHISISINLNKSQNKKNKINNNNLFTSPKNFKDNNFHLLSKLEEFQTNIIRPNTSFHHKRNKTVYLHQNQISTNNNPSNTLNTLGNILTKYNNTRNYPDNFKTTSTKQGKFNNYLTINNNLINKQRGFNDIKNRVKNKTFEIENINSNIINKINHNKENYKIYQKNKNIYQNNHLEGNNNNQVIIIKNNLAVSTGSKFNLTKKVSKNNNRINIGKNVKNSNMKYFNPKFTPINCFNKNIINNSKNNGLHKKSQTTILSNILETSPKNQITSPMTNPKYQNKIFNINQSENISSKIRPKIKNKINNLNINFNNVIFNAPLSNINQNFNVNTNFINNTNESLSYKLLTPTNNNNQNKINNTFSNNKNNNYNYSNIANNKTQQNENINYITNLKNFSNFSRNKINLYESSLSQNDENYSLIKTNSIKGKIYYDQKKLNTHIVYNNLYDKNEIFKKKKSEIIPVPNNNKNLSLKKGTKTSGINKKSKKKIESRNKKFEDIEKNYGKTETYKKTDIHDKINDSFKTKEDTRNNNNTNNLFCSPNTTGRIFTVQPINVNRNTNLMSKKFVKTKQKIKLK